MELTVLSFKDDHFQNLENVIFIHNMYKDIFSTIKEKYPVEIRKKKWEKGRVYNVMFHEYNDYKEKCVVDKVTAWNARICDGESCTLHPVNDNIDACDVMTLSPLRGLAHNDKFLEMNEENQKQIIGELQKKYRFCFVNKHDVIFIVTEDGTFYFYVIDINPSRLKNWVVTNKTMMVVEFEETFIDINQQWLIGGLDEEIKMIRQHVQNRLFSPLLSISLFSPGVLLIGPSGIGKSLLVDFLVMESGFGFFSVPIDVVLDTGPMKISEVFRKAREKSPSIVFLDNIDRLFPENEESLSSVFAERVLIEEIDKLFSEKNNVMVLATTTKETSVPTHLREFGRFSTDIVFGMPTSIQRQEIINEYAHVMKLEMDEDIVSKIAKELNGFHGGAIKQLCKNVSEINRKYQEKREDVDLYQLFMTEKKNVAKKNNSFALSEIPSVSSTSIENGTDDVQRRMEDVIRISLTYGSYFQDAGISPPRGMLMYGPPGCGKTMYARNVASKGNFNFIHVKGPEFFDKYIGESERKVRELFEKARLASPCVLFFDEFDSIAKKRGQNNNASVRIVNQLLTEMDGMDEKKDVFIIGATNLPDEIDPAIRRPGRLDQLVYIPPPDENSIKRILEMGLLLLPENSYDIDGLITTIMGKIKDNKVFRHRVCSGADITDICTRVRMYVADHAKREKIRLFGVIKNCFAFDPQQSIQEIKKSLKDMNENEKSEKIKENARISDLEEFPVLFSLEKEIEEFGNDLRNGQQAAILILIDHLQKIKDFIKSLTIKKIENIFNMGTLTHVTKDEFLQFLDTENKKTSIDINRMLKFFDATLFDNNIDVFLNDIIPKDSIDTNVIMRMFITLFFQYLKDKLENTYLPKYIGIIDQLVSGLLYIPGRENIKNFCENISVTRSIQNANLDRYEQFKERLFFFSRGNIPFF